MKALSSFPNRLFPFQSVSQRLNLEYDEIDETMDRLFADMFKKPATAPATRQLAAPRAITRVISFI